MKSVHQMWLLVFVGIAQATIFAERILNRIVLLVIPTERTETKKLSDRLIISAFAAQIWTTMLMLLNIISAVFETMLRNVMLVLTAVAVMVLLTILADSTSFVYVVAYNMYNDGIGYLLNLWLIIPTQLAHNMLGSIIPIYNAFVWITSKIFTFVLFPMLKLEENTKILPELIDNLGLLFSATAISAYELVNNVVGCVLDTAVDNVPYTSNVQCLANTNHMTLDLMTPGLYLRGVIRNVVAIISGSCSVAKPVLEIVTYPVQDYHFYKAVHCATHAVVHTFVALPIITYKRCRFGRDLSLQDLRGIDKFSPAEQNVMCMPDWTPLGNIMVAFVRSMGKMYDNLLDVSLVVLEEQLGLTESNRCKSNSRVTLGWNEASDVFESSENLRIVGMTDALYAITDGSSTAYQRYGDPPQTSLSLFNWPFRVDTTLGIAAIQFAEVGDTDSMGDARTGMLGCKCVNLDEGLMISCASVPYQVRTTDDDEDDGETMIHPIVFDGPIAASMMTCERVDIRVTSLRFSRRRFSAPIFGIDAALNDPYSTSSQRESRSNTADAAIYITPKCNVKEKGTDAACVPDSPANCFPWCMGLHVAGRKNQKIIMYSQNTWEFNVNLAQTDCTVAVDDYECTQTVNRPKPWTVSEEFNTSFTSHCDFAYARCHADENSNTWRPSDPEERQRKSDEFHETSKSESTLAAPTPSIRLSQQPFVAAGDIFLYAHDDRLSVARLRSSGGSEYSVKQDRLSIDSNARTVGIYEPTDNACKVLSNNLCPHNAVLENKVVVPISYEYWSPQHSTTAVSEWAVHWVVAPELSVLCDIMQRCQVDTNPSFCLQLTSSFGTPRMWSLKTVRATDAMGKETDLQSVSFMSIPDWIGPGTGCHEEVNIRVVGVEYLNRNNLLMSTLSTTPSNFRDNRVIDESKVRYKYYFVHPNRFDCVDTNEDMGDDTKFSCWRDESQGMFSDETEIEFREPGTMCPAMQRMPQLGSTFAEVAAAAIIFFRIIANAVFVIPAAVADSGFAGFSDLLSSRESNTFHSILDTDGELFMDIESITIALDLGSDHLWNSLGKISDLLRGTSGHATTEGLLIGTSKVMRHVDGASAMDAAGLAMFKRATSAGGVGKDIGTELSVAATSSPMGNLPAPVSSIRRASMATTKTMKVSAKIASRGLRMILRFSAQAAKLAAKQVADPALDSARKAVLSSGNGGRVTAYSLFSTILYDLRGSVNINFLDNVRAQCDGLSQILGRTSPYAKFVKEACLLGPDGLDGFLSVLLTLGVSYPIMNCICKLPEGEDSKAVIQEVCLKAALPMAFEAWGKTMLNLNADVQESMCFSSMDIANKHLLTAFDPFLSRLFKVGQAMESSLDYLTISFKSDAGRCEDLYGSAYVMTLMPEPVDYFMRCMHTFDCRARCLDTHTAFENALETTLAGGGTTPVYSFQKEVTVQNRYFSSQDVERNRHLPPFTIKQIHELPPETCQQYICKNTRSVKHSKCLVAAGVDSSEKIAIAYYCVPGDISQFVFVYAALPFIDQEPQYALPGGEHLLDLHFLTTNRVDHGSRELLLAHTYENGVWSLHVHEPEPDLTRWEVFSTTEWDPDTYNKNTDSTNQPMQRIDKVWVVSDNNYAHVYIGGQRMQLMDGYETQYESVQACVSLVIELPVPTLAFLGKLTDPGIQRNDCTYYMEVVLPEHHINVCLSDTQFNSGCTLVMALPTKSGGEVILSNFWVSNGTYTRIPVPAKTRRGKGLASALELNERTPLYLTQYGAAAETRRHLSSIAYNSENPVVFVSGVRRQAWIQNVRLTRRYGDEFRGERSISSPRKMKIEVNIECSLDNCMGCTSPAHLQSKCMAAQQCAVARCVGSTVNMRKPLCNVAKVLAASLDAYRVSIGGIWLVLAKQTILVVELSKQRRKQYELDSHEEVFNAAVCNAKDALVEGIATVTSTIGAVSYEQQQEPAPGLSGRSARLDTRYHARFVLSLAATTNMISSVFMGPLYAVLAAQKTMTCLTNDAILIIHNIVSGVGSDDDPLIVIGSHANALATSETVGVCLSEQMGTTLRDVSTRASKIDNEAVLILEQINDLITRLPFEPLQHSLDAMFAWALGIVSGMIDVIQTGDMKNCKLPTVGGGGVHECVCGDLKAKIPPRQRTDTKNAYWCQGPLLLNNWNGDDVLIWNRFTLAELLSKADYDTFLKCLEDNSDCDQSQPPNIQAFESQGVEIMQVVNRCRANYQQRQWDEGAIYLGLFSVDEWEYLDDVSVSRVMTDEPMAAQRMRVLSIKDEVRGPFDKKVIECFQAAVSYRTAKPACMQEYLRSQGQVSSGVDEYFVYETSFEDGFGGTDACQSFSNEKTNELANNAAMPLSIWSGSSSNKESVATPHLTTVKSFEDRILEAETKLDKLYTEEISEYFKSIPDISEHVKVDSFSYEKDELHQYVDCVFIGPYSAADMHASFDRIDGSRFPVEQYYRHLPHSREFSEGLETGGSSVRKSIMKILQLKVSEMANVEVVESAKYVMSSIRSQFADKNNLMCKCSETETSSILCCVQNEWTSLSQVTFPADAVLHMHWDISHIALTNILEAIDDGEYITRDVWTSSEFSTASTLTTEDKYEMHRMYMFEPDQTVMEYSLNEIMGREKKSLWTQCTNLLSSGFFTMPVRENSDPLEVDADMIYDPTMDSNVYMHGMEEGIQRILKRARRDSPVYWTHVHRYMPSDSMWCENSAGPTPPDSIDDNFSEQTFYAQTFHTDKVQNPSLNEVDMVADMGSRCFCGWYNSDNVCVIHSQVNCTRVAGALDEIDLRISWLNICNAGTYTSHHDLFVVMEAMNYAIEETPDCLDLYPSTTWGLMDSDGQGEWWNSNSAQTDLRHMASHGPAGLRIGLIGNSTPQNSLFDHVQSYSLRRNTSQSVNYKLKHTIAQPVCKGTQSSYFQADLRKYFQDVLFPMAHTVHESPVSAYCSTWAIEFSILHAFEQVLPANHNNIIEQHQTVDLWRDRCLAQLEQIGICMLRGVFDITPSDEGTEVVPAHCRFGIKAGTKEACEAKNIKSFYITSNCLVKCGTDFYDPCLCDDTKNCENIIFDEASCDSGKIVDARAYANSPDIMLFSMHWPTEIPAIENNADGNVIMAKTLSDLLDNPTSIDVSDLYAKVRLLLLQRESMENEGDPPESFCDDLFDYFDPDAQHPVGYHPTCACSTENTLMRGFDEWMSVNEQGSPLIDPIRLRNMTAYSSLLGHSHVLCDASIYGLNEESLNPYFLETEWDQMAFADVAIPLRTPASYNRKQQKGTNSNPDSFDTPLMTEDPHGFQHSVGLVRDWLRAPTDDVNEIWPNWDAADAYGTLNQVDNCVAPPQYECTEDSHCRGDEGSDVQMKCHKNAKGEVGVCFPSTRTVDEVEMHTCYMHSHCTDIDRICSGRGLCEKIHIRVQNDLENDIEFQIFARECDLDGFGFTKFEGVEDFVTANGMCGVKNRFHYRKIVNSGVTKFQSVQGKVSHTLNQVNGVSHFPFVDQETDTSNPLSLIDHQVLKAKAHACDRNYQHTDHKICTHHNVEAKKNGKLLEDSDVNSWMWAFRTWERDQAENTYINFCSIEEDKLTGFLHPYEYFGLNTETDEDGRDTLVHVPEDIQTCGKYRTCPAANFIADGNVVKRKVFTARTIPTPQGSVVSIHNQDANIKDTRRYTNADASTCLGMGYRVLDENAKPTTRCVVDRATVPLLTVLFHSKSEEGLLPINNGCVRFEPDFVGDRNTGFCADAVQNKFEVLREHCPDAFGEIENEANRNFKNYMTRTTRIYNEHERNDVMDYVNSLLDEVFGNNRGFLTLGEYVTSVKCVEYIFERLIAINEDTSDNTIEYERDETVDVRSGDSMYFFLERAAIYVPFSWYWQCVMLADYANGGAPHNWKVLLTDPSMERNYIECPNYEIEEGNTQITLGKFLRQTKSILDISNEDSISTDTLFHNELKDMIHLALFEMDLTSIPNVHCVKKFTTDSDSCYFTNSALSYIKGADDTIRFIHDDVLFPQPDSDSPCLLKEAQLKIDTLLQDDDMVIDRVLQSFFVNAEEGYSYTSWRALTVENMKQNGILEERDIEKTMVLPSDKSFPEYTFAMLNDINLPPTYEYAAVNGGDTIYRIRDDVQEEYASTACCANGISPCELNDICLCENMAEFKTRQGKAFRAERILPPGTIVTKMGGATILTMDEVVYLVSRYMKVYLTTLSSQIANILHRVEEDWALKAMYRPTISQKLELMHTLADHSHAWDLQKYKRYNEEMSKKTHECDDNSMDIEYDSVTNTAFKSLQHCHKGLQRKVGWIVERNDRIELMPTDKNIILGGFYPVFLENVPKYSSRESGDDDSDQFVDETLSEKWAQSERRRSNDNSFCFMQGQNVRLMNPVLAGSYDIDSGCETTGSRDSSVWTVDGRCDGVCKEKHGDWATLLATKLPEHCSDEHLDVKVRVNVQYKDQYTPICDRRFNPTDVCVRHHGTLNGDQGSLSEDLHDTTTSIPDVEGGLWSPTNSVIRGGVTKFSGPMKNMKYLETDIGGHAIMFRVNSLGFLSLYHLRMGNREKESVHEMKSWMKDIDQVWASNNARYNKAYIDVHDSRVDVDWHCPLQRLTAVSGKITKFQYMYPSASRNKIMFEHITKSSSHATVSGLQRLEFLNDGKFMSEFDICTAEDKNECQRADILQNLIGNLRNNAVNSEGVTVQLRHEGLRCEKILDWPMQPLFLVDREYVKGDDYPDYCNVYDRIPEFNMHIRYRHPQPTPRSHSQVIRGVCRMGRLRRIEEVEDSTAPFSVHHCFPGDANITCIGSNSIGERVQNIYPFKSHPIPDRTRTRKNKKCGLCNHHDSNFKYKNRNGHETPTPVQKNPMSVGIPVQMSMARMVAAHIRRVVCNKTETCPQLDKLLEYDSDMWQKSNFLSYMLDSANHTRHRNVGQKIEDEILWNRPWVWCRDGECSGSVSKEEWVDPNTRGGSCRRVIGDMAKTEDKIPLSFCLIDATTTEMCQKVSDWKATISQIICTALGMPECQQEEYFYSPTTYSVSNGEFVHDTVQKFYETVGSKKCDTLTLDEKQLKQKESNDELRDRCPSRDLVPMREAIQALREIKTLVIELLFYFSAGITQLGWLLSAVMTVNEDLIKRAGDKMLLYLELFMLQIVEILDELARLVFKVVFGQGLPEKVLEMTQVLCQFMNWIKREIIGTSPKEGMLCIVLNTLGDAFFSVAGLVKDIMDACFLNMCPFSGEPLSSVFTFMKGTGRFFKKILPCSKDILEDCDFLYIPEDEEADGKLPAATRCWSTYATFYGDGQQLSCTAADTCHTSLVDSTLVVCGSCPQGDNSKRQFACSDITKICTCNVPIMRETLCSANAECDHEDATCRYIDNEYQPSFGSVSCKLCENKRMCFMQPGDSSVCACGLNQIKFAQCKASAKTGTTSHVKVDDMCLHTTDSTFQEQSLFTQRYADLLAVPCTRINQANAFCTVIMDMFSLKYVVAARVTSTRRRLLSLPAADESENIFTHSALCRDALSSVVLPETRSACVDAYDYSVTTVALLEMQQVLPPCIFCSLEDFTSAILADPLLLPTLGAHPERLAHIVERHTPLYHISKFFTRLRRTLRILAKDMSTNESSPALQHFLVSVHNKSQSTRHLLAIPTIGAITGLSDTLKASGGQFSEKFAKMRKLREAYSQTLSSFFLYDMNAYYETEMWGDGPTTEQDPTKAYYKGKSAEMPTGPLRDAWPVIHHNTQYVNIQKEQPFWDASLDVVSASLVWATRWLVHVMHLRPSSVNDLIVAIFTGFRELMKCDLEKVQTCSDWKVRLIHGIFIVVCYSFVIYYALSALSLSFVGMILVPLGPMAVLYICYGYSPFCLPMIPTCFLLDVYTTLESLFPRQLYVPYALFKPEANRDACTAYLRVDCLIPCSDPPYSYRNWQDVIAWGAAEVGPDLYEPLQNLLVATGFANDLPMQIATKNMVYLMEDISTINANRVCAFVNMYKVFPLILCATLSLFLVFAISRLLITLIFATILLVNSVILSIFTE